MPAWLTDDLNGIRVWMLPLIIVGALAMGYLLTKYGGVEE